jgi:aspartate kinase
MTGTEIQVFKFGGSSVKDAEGYRNVAKIIERLHQGPLIVVLSAMGKTTNALEEVVKKLLSEGVESANESLAGIASAHIEVARTLGIPSKWLEKVEEHFDTTKQRLAELSGWGYDSAYDQIVSTGELASTSILCGCLAGMGVEPEWVDARQVIATNDIHRDATVDWEKSSQQVSAKLSEKIEEGKVMVTQGFIGGYDGVTTTLGREGSDYTAAILSYILDAGELSIWKDVPGILSGDPREFDHVIKIDRMSYREAIEMTYYGAKVIHPKTIKPLQNKGIRLHVRPFLTPDEEGTIITHDVEVAYPPIVVVEKDQCLLHISTRDFSFVAEHHMSIIFNMISIHRIKVNMMRNTAISFTVCVTDPGDRLGRLVEDLSKEFSVVKDPDLELITIRHSAEPGIQDIVGNRIVIFEERIRSTVQMVVRSAPGMKRKA